MKKYLKGAAFVIFWLAVWQIAAMVFDQKLLLASPIAVAGRLIQLAPQSDFWASVGFSAGRILLGFAIGVSLGTLLAALAGSVGFVKQLLSPLMSAMKSIPVASFTILALIWVSSKNLAVLIAVLISVPIVYTNVLEGIENLDPKLKEMAEIFNIPPAKRFVGVYLSQVMPYFRSAAGLAMGLCWKSGVAAEVIGIPDGSIGERLYMSKVYLETEDLFAWTVVIILVSWLCERLFRLLLDILVKRIERM